MLRDQSRRVGSGMYMVTEEAKCDSDREAGESKWRWENEGTKSVDKIIK